MNRLILYRKICLKEAKDIERRLFQLVDTGYKDTRKWFTESIIGALRFQNPYAEIGNEVVVKILVEEPFLNDPALSRMIFDKNQGYRFYRNAQIDGPIIVCPTHLVTTKFSNYGMRQEAVQVLNRHVEEIDLFSLEEMTDLYLRENFGVQTAQDLITTFATQTDNYFYIAMPQDLGLALKKEQLIFTEGMKAGRKRLVSKDLDTIRKECSELPSILAVELKDDPVATEWCHQLERTGMIELDVKEIMKINPWISHVELIECDLSKDQYTVYQHTGNNQRLLHQPKTRKEWNPLTNEERKAVKRKVQEKDYESLETLLPPLQEMKDCYQLDPKHIDDVKEHTMKGLSALDQVLETFAFVYEPSEEEKFIMQMSMLFHDVGKPYTNYPNNVTRYTQFIKHYENNGKAIVEQLFKEDSNKDLLKLLSSLSTVIGKRAYHHFFADLKETVKEEQIERGIFMMFVLKVAHIMTLRPQKFSGYYQESLRFIHEFLFYQLRTWRIENEANQIITSSFVEQLPTLETVLQPYYENEKEALTETVKPILLELLNTGLDGFYNHDFLQKQSKYLSLPPQMELKEAEILLTSSSVYPLFQEELSSVRLEHLLNSKVHGIYHNEKVAFFATIIAILEGCTKKEISLLLKTALYHDCGRENDHEEERHGVIGAFKFKQLFESEISVEDMRIMMFMIEAHAIPDSSIKELLTKYHVTQEEQEWFFKMASILKDADGLDRVRISTSLPYSKLNPNYLRTVSALKLVKVSHGLNECYQKQVFYGGNLVKRKVYQKSNLYTSN